MQKNDNFPKIYRYMVHPHLPEARTVFSMVLKRYGKTFRERQQKNCNFLFSLLLFSFVFQLIQLLMRHALHWNLSSLTAVNFVTKLLFSVVYVQCAPLNFEVIYLALLFPLILALRLQELHAPLDFGPAYVLAILMYLRTYTHLALEQLYATFDGLQRCRVFANVISHLTSQIEIFLSRFEARGAPGNDS